MTFHHGKTYASTTFTNRTVIRHTIGKLENNLTLLDDTRPIRPCTARTVENIATVNKSFAEDPEESIRRRSQQLGLSYGTTWAIFDAGN